MKNILAGFLCVALCIAVAILLPQTGTSNPNVDDTGCLASGCHVVADLHAGHGDAGCDACHETEAGGGPVPSSSCLACHPETDSELCDLVDAHPESAGCLDCHEEDCEEEPIPGDCSVEVITLVPVLKSNWFVLPGLVRIQVEGFALGELLRTPVDIACEFDGNGTLPLDSVLNTGKLIQPVPGSETAIIWQSVLVWPTWITQSGGREVEACTVTVGECGDTGAFELQQLPIFLSE